MGNTCSVAKAGNNLRWLNLILGAIHIIMGLIVYYTVNKAQTDGTYETSELGMININTGKFKWTGPPNASDGGLDIDSIRNYSIGTIKWYLTIFYVLTGLMHFIFASDISGFYSAALKSENAGIRWIMYGFAAFFYMTAMFHLCNVSDDHMVSSLYFLAPGLMLLHYVTDMQAMHKKAMRTGIAALAATLISGALAYYVLRYHFDAYNQYEEATTPSVKAPYWYTFFTISIVLFFFLTPILQFGKALFDTSHVTYEMTHMIIDSLAKLFLGLGVVIGITRNAEENAVADQNQAQPI